MKKLLLVPAIVALSTGGAFAQSAFTGIANSFGGGFTANATVSQSVGNIGYAAAQQYATVVQNTPTFGGASGARGISNSFLGGFNATATVNQSVIGSYNGANTVQAATVIQNSPTFSSTSP